VTTANKDKDNYQLNQDLFKIPADFHTQCSDAIAWGFTARKLHARPQPDSGRCTRSTEVATERQLCGGR